MKIILIFISLSAAAFLWLACKQTKYTPGNFPDRQLRWGSGGGFTGKETTHTLLENGQIFTHAGEGALTESGKVKAKRAKMLYEMIGTLGLDGVHFQHPGNTYDFIEVLSGDSVNRISWGDRSHPVDPKIKDLFDQLNALLKK